MALQLAEILEKANAGDSNYMLLASRRYHDEVRDEALSRYWLERAAESENPEYLSYIGEVAEHGWGVSRDPVFAEHLYKKARFIETFIGAYMLGRMHEMSDPPRALEYLEEAANLGHIPSKILLLRLMRSAKKISSIGSFARGVALVCYGFIAVNRPDSKARYWRYRDVMRPVRIIQERIGGSDRTWGEEMLSPR